VLVSAGRMSAGFLLPFKNTKKGGSELEGNMPSSARHGVVVINTTATQRGFHTFVMCERWQAGMGAIHDHRVGVAVWVGIEGLIPHSRRRRSDPQYCEVLRTICLER
jgi:hypothetical protein